MKRIRIGSRDSVLAVRQAQIVMDIVKGNNADIEFELVKIKTTGDKILDRSLEEVGGKGLFIKELEQALIRSEIDIAVHSYKDMPYEDTEGLPIVALSEREAPFDVLVLPEGIKEPDRSKPVGSSSSRRSIQFRKMYEGFDIKPVRGNVPTRIAKLDNGEYSALILAQAGLNRLSLRHRISRVFTIDEMIPSGSQGIIAVQGREGEDYSYLQCFHNTESEIVSMAERTYLKALKCDCTSPVAVYGEILGDGLTLVLTGMFTDANGKSKTGKILGKTADAILLGEELARQLVTNANNR